MIEDLGEPRFYPSLGFDLNFSKLYYQKERIDPSEISSLLEKCNYQHEEILLYTYGRHEKDALWIKEQCAKYHIHLSVVINGWNEILENQLM